MLCATFYLYYFQKDYPRSLPSINEAHMALRRLHAKQLVWQYSSNAKRSEVTAEWLLPFEEKFIFSNITLSHLTAREAIANFIYCIRTSLSLTLDSRPHYYETPHRYRLTTTALRWIGGTILSSYYHLLAPSNSIGPQFYGTCDALRHLRFILTKIWFTIATPLLQWLLLVYSIARLYFWKTVMHPGPRYYGSKVADYA